MNAPLQASGMKIVPSQRREWTCIAVVASCFAILGLIFQQEAVGAYRVWIGSETYNHCFLILPITLYMIWQRREVLSGLSPRPEFRALLLILPLSLFWFGISIFGVLEAQQFVVLTIFQVMLLGLLGWPTYRALMAPFLYLYFLVPTGEVLVPYLQDFTARFAVLGLQALGVPVYSDGVLIDVPSGSFAVAEACAGLRFLIAAVAFGVFYAVEMYESRARRIVFIVLSVVVPVIANGFRALGLILASEVIGSAAAIDADHVTFGWVFFSLVLVALIFIGRAFSDGGPAHKPAAPAGGKPAGPLVVRNFAVAGALAVGLAAMGPAVGFAIDAAATGTVAHDSPPPVASAWRPLEGTVTEWRPIVARADREYFGGYTDGVNRVERFIALYAWRGRANDLIRSTNRIANEEMWHPARRGRAFVNIGGARTPVNFAEIVGPGRRLLVWWFYALDNSTAASLMDVKLHQARAYLTGQTCPSAMLAVATEIVGDADQAAMTLQSYLDAMTPLPEYLCGSGLPVVGSRQ